MIYSAKFPDHVKLNDRFYAEGYTGIFRRVEYIRAKCPVSASLVLEESTGSILHMPHGLRISLLDVCDYCEHMSLRANEPNCTRI